MVERLPDRVERVPAGARLLNVAFDVTTPAHGLGMVEVSFEAVEALRERLRAERGLKVGHVAVLVKAVAKAIALEPQAHVFLEGGRCVHPGNVDVGVSVAGKGSFAPVAVIESVESKPLAAVVEELRALSEAKRLEEDRAIRLFGILYWVLAVDWVRRAVLRLGLRRFVIVRRLVGTIQVSTLPQLDLFWPLRFASSAVIALGRVRPRPWVVDGVVQSARVGRVAISIDHRVLDGWKADRLLGEIARILEDPAELETLL